jgi:hypothetical protein
MMKRVLKSRSAGPSNLLAVLAGGGQDGDLHILVQVRGGLHRWLYAVDHDEVQELLARAAEIVLDDWLWSAWTAEQPWFLRGAS